MLLEHVLASKYMDPILTMKKIVVYHQEHTPWIANVRLEMDGMEVMLKSMESNTVIPLKVDIA